MNVVFVTHDSVYGRYVAAGLCAATRIDRVIVETGRPPLGFFLRKLHRVGPANIVFQAWLNQWFVREGRKHLPELPLPAHERIATINECRFGADDLVIGFGTSYVNPATLAATPRGILNLHTGLLPEYRGVKSEFWALHNGDYSRIGWTLHYMTLRLDEGHVVLRQRIPWSGENPAALRAKLLDDAVPTIGALVSRVRDWGFETIPRSPQGEGRYYTTPTFADWRRYARTSRQSASRTTHAASRQGAGTPGD
jgi:hypothetical protein